MRRTSHSNPGWRDLEAEPEFRLSLDRVNREPVLLRLRQLAARLEEALDERRRALATVMQAEGSTDEP